jgi:hypothetical protein
MVRPPTLTESEPAGQPVTQAEPPPAADERCAACGAAMAGDQEWCLECGVARTVIQSPPDWRLGVAIVLAVVAVVVLVTVIVWP